MTKLESLQQEVRSMIPQARVAPKESSILMKFVNVFVCLFSPKFMTQFITTVGYTSYFPTAMLDAGVKFHEYDVQNAAVFAHEAVHMYDRKRNPCFPFLYLLPQLLGLLSFLSLLSVRCSHLWLLALGFLVFLGPLPAYFRMRYELRGYTMTMAVNKWIWGDVNRDYVTSEFTGPEYYFMWPFKVDTAKRIQAAKDNITSGQVLSEPMFRLVYDWIQKQKLTIS